MDTKDRILDASLTLFATKGYGDVRVGEIAKAVGIKAPSLYKHFKSKRAIFDALVEKMTKDYAEQAQKIGIDGVSATADATVYVDISEESLLEVGRNLFEYFLHDSYVSRFRRMLTLEQFRNPELGLLYSKQYLDEPLAYHTQLFGLLTEAGTLVGKDPELMAIEFYTPIYAMLTACDRNPSLEPEALRTIDAHIRQFNKHYRADEQTQAHAQYEEAK